MKPVLIVGAGPTGLTAAMELARFGIPVRLVDKKLKASTTSRALAVQARTLELLEQRGLTEEMLQLGNVGKAATIYRNGARLGQVPLSKIKSRYNYILLLSQAETERLLSERIVEQGVKIERGTELVAFSQHESRAGGGAGGGGVKAILKDQNGNLEEVDAAYMISAEGAHSLARHTLDLEFKGRALGETYALGDLFIDSELPEDELSIFLADEAFLAVFPMGNKHFRLITTNHEKAEKPAISAEGAPSLAELQHNYDKVSHIPARLRDATWTSYFKINSRMLQTLRRGDIFFGGDAAHIHSPAGGQGMNTGIQDMIDLCWKMAYVLYGLAAPELLKTYEDDRLPIIRSIVAKTEAATDAFNSRSAFVHQVLQRLAPVLLDTPFVQQLSTGLISEISSNYRVSPLSQNLQAYGEIHAGDRVPDLQVKIVEGASSFEGRLHDLLDCSRFTLLSIDGELSKNRVHEELKPWGELVVTKHISTMPAPSPDAARFKELFGRSPGLFLVRPDSYMGFVGAHEDWPSLVKYFERWFPTRDQIM